jgi:hypothetical protein
MKVFVADEVVQEADLDVYCVNVIEAHKISSESVTSSTVLQDDDVLTVTVAASSVYELSGVLFYDGASGAADLKFSWVGPAGATMEWSSVCLSAAAVDTGDIEAIAYATIGAVGTAGTLGAGTNLAVLLDGLLTVAGTAGTFKLQWAQNTSNGTATRVLLKSYIVLRRID